MLKRSVIFLSALGLFAMPAVGAARDAPEARAEDWSPGTRIADFALERSQPIPEIGAHAFVFVHAPTGARLLKLLSADDNRTFAIAFRTPPQDDTGAAHILEHAVLNGSKKYPVKSPFHVLSTGSLNTYLNALTEPEYTIYPVASRNDRELFHLVDIYLDAVLHPLVLEDRRIFLQEGFRLELTAEDAPLVYNGIVYNEMKGYFTGADDLLRRAVLGRLFRGGTYGYESGGTPEGIPAITFERLCDFYRRTYHPSNAYIMFYGDGDTREELGFVSRALAGYRRAPVRAVIRRAPRFPRLQELEIDVPAEAGAGALRALFALAFVAGDARDPRQGFLFDILSDVLVNAPAAPLRRALIEAGIGEDLWADYQNLQPGVFQITLKNADPADLQRFKRIVFAALARVAEEGVDRKLVQASLNRLEFELREADHHDLPAGLGYLIQAMPAWLAADDPIARLAFEQTLRDLRQDIDQRLKRMIRQDLLKNPHVLLALARPKAGLLAERERVLAERLARTKAALPEAARQGLVAEHQALLRYQQTPDRPEDVARVPLLSLSEVEPRVEPLELEERTMAGVPALVLEQPTKGIAYTRLLFDTRAVPLELVPYLQLLSVVLGQLSTERHSFGDLSAEVGTHAGGLEMQQKVFLGRGGGFEPRFTVGVKALGEEIGPTFALLAEILSESRFDDHARLRELLREEGATAERIPENGGDFLAKVHVLAGLYPYAAYVALIRGLPYLKFATDLARRADAAAAEVAARLREVAGLVLHRQALTLVVSGRAQEIAQVERALPTLLAALGGKRPLPLAYPFTPEVRREGLVFPTDVQHVVQAADLGRLGVPYSGKFRVLAQVLETAYLHQAIREQGGAYGAYAAFEPNGDVTLESYRDPNLARTLEIFARAPAFIESLEISLRDMTRFILGVIANMDVPLPPAQRVDRALRLHLEGITRADRQRERDEILQTTAADLRALAPILRELLAERVYAVFGGPTLRANASLFTRLVDVLPGAPGGSPAEGATQSHPPR